MTTMTKIPDETPIAEVVSTLRAQRHLIAAGITTLGHVRKRGIGECIGIKYVGQKSVDELRAAIGVQGDTDGDTTTTAPDEEYEYEENGLPVLVERTPSGPSFIAFTPANKIPGPGGAGYQVQKPIFIEFDAKGRASISARMYFMRKFRRNEERVDAAIDEGREWRNECVRTLRSFQTHGTGFIVLTD